ncbi:hypothetical protein SNOG_07389 [Parastagonospora nodorum SN15]|uniref:Uncharacterized protein n=1 Tax=Phaeosphaeria nodorum (strain SN15 / ATCC MYA-4574 / FGSC 10173) TaxID=321614 RepID=Q0ULH5_PHANO|nr:hypothetical protein SNOG_07389 [Parastagonospora nodorum SN15]EAT84855.1 hypothetical protein SNOG_07389 [Parastagonospora nodorum SN15]
MSSNTRQTQSHISLPPARPQPATCMSQTVPKQKLKTMADLDKEEEAKVAKTHRRRKTLGERIEAWVVMKRFVNI